MPPIDWEAVAERSLHPAQIEILRELAKGRALSPVLLSRRLTVRLDTVAYHVRTLRDRGLLAETHTVRRRGATEHFYALAPRQQLAAA